MRVILFSGGVDSTLLAARSEPGDVLLCCDYGQPHGIEIDFDGTIIWNGTPVSGVDAVEGFFRSESQKDPQPELHLRPDKRAKYDVVARVLAAAQRNRMKKIGFVNVAEFSE